MQAYKKLFWTSENWTKKVVMNDWDKNSNEIWEKAHERHMFTVSVPLELMRELVKTAALHQGWDVTKIELDPAFDEEEKELDSMIQETQINRGRYIALLDWLSDFGQKADFSLCVESITLSDGEGNSIRIFNNGDVILTGLSDALENAVNETIMRYLA